MAKDDPYNRAIKALLRAQRRPLSTLKIARKTSISWPTTDKHLKLMLRSGSVNRRKKGRKNLWSIG